MLGLYCRHWRAVSLRRPSVACRRGRDPPQGAYPRRAEKRHAPYCESKNMNRHFRMVVSLLSAIVMISGCLPSQPEVSKELEASFRSLVPIDDMNRSIRIRVDTEVQEDLKFGSDIHVVIDNLSDQQIYFPLGFGIRLFVVGNHAWIEAQDKNTSYGDGSLLRARGKEEMASRISTWVRPIFPSQLNEGQQEILRIVLVGELMADGKRTGVPVGAYTDVFVNP